MNARMVSSVALAEEDTLRRVAPDEACGGCHGRMPVGLHLTLLLVIAWHYKANAAQLHLTWTDNSNNEDGFKIERKKEASGTFKQIAVLGGKASYYKGIDFSNPDLNSRWY
jgi:hypothetical protein